MPDPALTAVLCLAIGLAIGVYIGRYAWFADQARRIRLETLTGAWRAALQRIAVDDDAHGAIAREALALEELL